jgi:hypothetical protein
MDTAEYLKLARLICELPTPRSKRGGINRCKGIPPRLSTGGTGAYVMPALQLDLANVRRIRVGPLRRETL